jgi:hypothetical protein
MQQQTARRV